MCIQNSLHMYHKRDSTVIDEITQHNTFTLNIAQIGRFILTAQALENVQFIFLLSLCEDITAKTELVCVKSQSFGGAHNQLTKANINNLKIAEGGWGTLSSQSRNPLDHPPRRFRACTEIPR